MEALDGWLTPVLLVGILAFLWNLHRDIAELRERMARLEGLFEGRTLPPIIPTPRQQG